MYADSLVTLLAQFSEWQREAIQYSITSTMVRRHAEYDVDEEGGDQVTGGGCDSEEGARRMLAAW